MEQLPREMDLERLLDLVSEGVVVLDARGEVVFRSTVADRLVGSGPTAALTAVAVEEAAGLARKTNRFHERRLELSTPQRRDLVIRAHPLEGGMAAVVIEDVSERRRLESVRRDFVANVSHELKTPVGALSLLAEALEGEDDPEVVSRLASRIGQEADRLVRIIDDLLDLSRIESDRPGPGEPVSIEQVVADSVQALEPVAASFNVSIHVERPLPEVRVRGDRRDLVSALSNLIDNAVKYSEPGEMVTVAVTLAGQEVEISVADTGVGIPARDLERIFERFYRVDRARSRLTGGTGLGLSIVRHVASNHGGSVRVRSVEGEGSVFTISLPVAGGEEPASA